MEGDRELGVAYWADDSEIPIVVAAVVSRVRPFSVRGNLLANDAVTLLAVLLGLYLPAISLVCYQQ